MPRFAILRHETPPGYPRPTHYDLMLEHGAALRTWAMAELPSPDHPVAAERLRDHPLDYLDYEGELSDGRGSVSRVDHGLYDLVSQSASELQVLLRGASHQLALVLVRESDYDDQRWRVAVSGD